MHKNGMRAAALAAFLVVAPGVALADSTLTLVMGGEGVDGPPKFSVTFDGKPIGQDVLASAIDRAKVGRFVDASDQTQYVQSFSFTIPDEVFKPDGIVAVELTNESEDTVAGVPERALYVQSVAVNGRIVSGRNLAMASSEGVEPAAIYGKYLVISRKAVDAIAAAPQGGWPATLVASTEAPAPVPADDVADTATAPMGGATQLVSATADEGNPDPEALAGDCGVTRSFQILGFNENSNDLTPKTRKALDDVVKALNGQKCVVHLTGYSSTEGDFAHNALFSIERSQNALKYLAAAGVKFRRYSANGVGETTQFGVDPNANRRVVVSVTP